MTSTLVAVLVAGGIGLPVGWVSWRVAQHYIDARPLEEGDTEFRLPAPTAIALTVGVFALLGWRYGEEPGVAAYYLGAYAFLQVLLLVDFGRYYLPNRLIVATLVYGVPAVALLALFVDGRPPVYYAYLGAVVNFVLYFAFWFLAQLAFGSRGMGFGDVKLAAALGLVVGSFPNTFKELVILLIWALLVGFLSGSLTSIVLLRMRGRGGRKAAFPLGPFLILGSVVVVAFPLRFLYT